VRRRYVLTRVDDSAGCARAAEAVASLLRPEEVCATRIRASGALADGGEATGGVLRQTPDSGVAQDYAGLAEELAGFLQ
jgi:hypothetical protein